MRNGRKAGRGGLFLAALLLIMSIQPVFAEDESDLKSLQSQQNEVGTKQTENQERLEAAKKKVDAAIEATGKLDQKITETELALQNIDGQIERNQAVLDQTKKDLESAREEEQYWYEELKQRIQLMYESGTASYLEVLLQTESISDLFSKLEYSRQLAQKDRETLENYTASRESVEEKKATIEDAEQRLEENRGRQEEKKVELQNAKEQKEKELAVFRSDADTRAVYQQYLEDLEKQIQQQIADTEAQIQQRKDEEAREAEEQRLREERERAEAVQKAKEEAERAESERRAKEESERAESERREQESFGSMQDSADSALSRPGSDEAGSQQSGAGEESNPEQGGSSGASDQNTSESSAPDSTEPGSSAEDSAGTSSGVPESAGQDSSASDSESAADPEPSEPEQDAPADSSGGGGLLWPLPGYTSISDGFYYRISPITGQQEFHGGIDIPAPYGTAIQASAGGTVITAGMNISYGNYVMISHGNGLVTLYAHASSLNVAAGQTVNAGDVIAFVGSTGDSTGNHLHFEVRVNGVQQQPLNYV